MKNFETLSQQVNMTAISLGITGSIDVHLYGHTKTCLSNMVL